MSVPAQQTNPGSKRVRASDVLADLEGTLGVAEDRSVRQRTDSSSSSVVVLESSPTVSASSAAASMSAASAIAISSAHLSLMRLAVVERQLVMQSLDLTSLAHLASTCRQMRGEALHREAGKFIPKPENDDLAVSMCDLNRDHPAHESPLSRAHIPVTLGLTGSLSLGQLQSLMNKALLFSYITALTLESDQWLKSRMLSFLAQPWIQGVDHVALGLSDDDSASSAWLQHRAVQRAVFALPSLLSVEIDVAPHTQLHKTALFHSQQLHSAVVNVDAPQARAIRALRQAPCLDYLRLAAVDWDNASGQPFREFIWCLPPTLTALDLVAYDVREAVAPRPVLKAFFQRTPLLRELSADWMLIAPLVQGMLDAGMSALPELTHVEFSHCDDDGLRPEQLRRFLHRFPAVHVCFELPEANANDPETIIANTAFATIYSKWPRVQIEPQDSFGPPSPHASDDDSGSDVEAVTDPGSDSEEQES